MILESLLALGLVVPGKTHVVVVDARGKVNVPSEGSTLQLNPGEVAWTWSPQCAPQRFAPPLPEILPCAATVPVRVQLLDARRRAVPGATVRWGTAEMLKEIPDELLPQAVADREGAGLFAGPKAGPLFLRPAGATFAGFWYEWTPGSAPRILFGRAANAATVKVLGPDGRPAADVRAELRAEEGPSPRQHTYWSIAPAGTLSVPPLPSDATVHLFLQCDRFAPVLLSTKAGKIPGTLSMQAGATLKARLVDAGGAPVPGASVEAVFLLPGQARGIRRRATSGPDGRVEAFGLGPGRVEWLVRKAGLETRTGTAPEGSTDLGTLTLREGRTLAVRVVDAAGQPVPSARVRSTSPSGLGATTGADGLAKLEGARADSDVSIAVDARGFKRAEAILSAGAAGESKPTVVRVERAARVVARLVRAGDGTPAGPGTARVDLDGRTYIEDFDSSGQVEIVGLAAGVLKLELRVDGLAPLRLPERRLADGETVDLGLLIVPAGFTVRGRLVDEATGNPAAGERVRVPRPNTFGPRLAAVMKDWVEGVSDADGRFQVAGLAAGAYSVLVEAGAHPPVLRKGVVLSSDGGPEVDLGDIALAIPRELSVSCEPIPRCGQDVRLLFGGPDDDWAVLRATLVEGRATIQPAPAGKFPVRLTARGETLAEKDAVVSEEEGRSELHFSLAGVAVEGLVTCGSRPASGGQLRFNPSRAPSNFVPVFVTRQGDNGVARDTIDVVGALPHAVMVAVDSDGTFRTEELTPGSYEVVYHGDSGGAKPQAVSIPEEKKFFLRLDLPGGELRGRVRQEDGQPPAWARVTAEDGGGSALQTYAEKDGVFAFLGVSPGRLKIRATNDDSEGTATLDVQEGRSTEVEIVLKPHTAPGVRVLLTDPSGQPVSGGLLCLRFQGAYRVAMTDEEGSARVSLSTPGSVLIAAFHPNYGWAFSDEVALEVSDTTAVSVVFSRSTGSLAVTCRRGPASVQLIAPKGFPLHEALSMFGLPRTVTLAEPLRLTGLPPGAYSVSLGGQASRSARIAAGREEPVDFP